MLLYNTGIHYNFNNHYNFSELFKFMINYCGVVGIVYLIVHLHSCASNIV